MSTHTLRHRISIALILAATLYSVQGAAQTQVQYICDVAVDAPASVRVAHEEYYACTQPLLTDWLMQHSERVSNLQALDMSWQLARGHDLRGRPEAARWVRTHPVNFSDRQVELTGAQVEQMTPTGDGAPAQVIGEFQRLFVDRDNARLFLTSAEEGLVSLSIAKRYDFQIEGRMGNQGAQDFFIYDANTAFVEESTEMGGNRDLVVLDISDRSNPREVTRLRGVLPQVGGANYFNPANAHLAPTFQEYRMIREGQMRAGSCGQPPTVSTHPGVHCRPDGTCYKRTVSTSADEGICQRIGVPEETRRRPQPRPRPTWDPSIDDLDERAIERSPVPSSAPRQKSAAQEPRRPSGPPAESGALREEAQAAPQGGAGGAGSLSQMMVHGTTLYVLSAAHNNPQGWLVTFDVANARQPKLRHLMGLDNGPEALQRHDNLLLVAGRDAVVTASLGVSHQPRLLGEFRQDCPVNFDPVVVQGSIAYRTIIVEGRRINCTSRLEVIDLSQPHQPVLRTTRPIARPRGLAVLGERLFVADEAVGVHVFDLTDPVNPAQAATWQLPGVKDLVLSDFDLYALTPEEIQTFYVAPLYQRDKSAQAAADGIKGQVTVARKKARRGWFSRFLGQ